jgi:Arc/MetJ-type ribon-helix-helix transcriptional regulator
MKTRNRWLPGCLALTVAALVGSGCSKNETYVEPAPAYDPAPVVQAPAPQQAPAPRGVPPPPTEADFDIRQVDALVQQRKYESAVDAMLRAQAAQSGRQLTDAQRLDNHNRMRLLQQQVAQAMASGDPEAKRAARLLQQYDAAQSRAGGR